MTRGTAGIDEAHQIGCVRLRQREGDCTCKRKSPEQVLREVLSKHRCACVTGCMVLQTPGLTVQDIVDEFHNAMSTNG